MVQFLSINFCSIFVGFFKISHFLCHPVLHASYILPEGIFLFIFFTVGINNFLNCTNPFVCDGFAICLLIMRN